MIRSAAAAAAALLLTPLAMAADPPVPDITGVWAGEGAVVLTITDQLGTAFDASLLAEGRQRPIYGVIQRDRREIMFINPEGNRRGELTAPDRMSFCLEAREDFKFTGPCVTLTRQASSAEMR